MKLVVTIDTEEDSWEDFPPSGASVENIREVPRVQALFDVAGVRPTYLVTYPVAVSDESRDTLRSILGRGACEIGTHCHPWNTPPLTAEAAGPSTMLCNLPQELQYRKLRTLHETIRDRFGVTPVSFRTGRWGYAPVLAAHLRSLGYLVDSSITPYTSWIRFSGPDFSYECPAPRWVDVPGAPGERLLQVPVTIGFLQASFERSNRILKVAERSQLRRLRAVGLLAMLRLVNKVWLSPELSSADEMIELTEVMRHRGEPLVNLTFHSPTLKPGLTPFVRTAADAHEFYRRLERYLEYARTAGLEPITLRESIHAS